MDSGKKGLDTGPRLKAIYVSYMSCHNDRGRTLSVGECNSPRGGVKAPLQHHYPLRAELDKGGLKVEPIWERILTENTGVSSYVQRKIDRRVRDHVSTQDEGWSQYLL